MATVVRDLTAKTLTATVVLEEGADVELVTWNAVGMLENSLQALRLRQTGQASFAVNEPIKGLRQVVVTAAYLEDDEEEPLTLDAVVEALPASGVEPEFTAAVQADVDADYAKTFTKPAKESK